MKSLTILLAAVALDLLHVSQAGFVSRRNITDQTQLIRLIMNYMEAKEENSLIVALDQEKAYDKISHDYLQRTLSMYDLPQEFI